MAVRFLPPPEERPTPQREDHEDLAEVIEFRTRLTRAEPPVADPAAPASPEIQEPGSAWPRLIEFPSPRVVPGGARAERPLQHSEESRTGETWGAGTAEGPGGPDSGVEDDGPSAYEDAVKLLSRRQLSSGELQRALVSAGHPDLDAETAVAHCVEALYLDDDALANAVATKLRDSKGESKARIRQKLRERHLPDDAIEGALSGLDDETEHELLRQTALDRARKLTGVDRHTAERRLLGFLARRGWAGERAARAARDALDSQSLGPKSGRSSVRFR